MKLHLPSAEIHVPDGAGLPAALERATHLGIGAHHDDLEVMAMEGILAAYGSRERWFAGVVVTDGAGSAREGPYSQFTDENMKAVRRQEQKKAAAVGEYAAQAFLDYPSADIKDPGNRAPVEDIRSILETARPEVAYIHNLADKHPTHVAVALRSIQAVRELPPDRRPRRLIGCEVWRDLDWLADEDKVIMPVDHRENIAAALIGVFDSQIAGGKRYDLAIEGRRRANATFHQSHAVDSARQISFGMDLTPLIHGEALDPASFVQDHIGRFAESVAAAIARMQAPAGSRPDR